MDDMFFHVLGLNLCILDQKVSSLWFAQVFGEISPLVPLMNISASSRHDVSWSISWKGLQISFFKYRAHSKEILATSYWFHSRSDNKRKGTIENEISAHSCEKSALYIKERRHWNYNLKNHLDIKGYPYQGTSDLSIQLIGTDSGAWSSKKSYDHRR